MRSSNVFRAHLIGLTIMVGCGAPERREAAPLPVPPSSPPASSAEPLPPRSSSTPSAEPLPSPSSSSSFRRTRSFDAGGGWEAKAAFAAIAPVLPDVDACYVALLARDAKAQGKARLELRQKEGRASGIGDEAFKACVKTALEKVTPPPVVSPGGTPTMVLEIDLYPSESAAPPLQKADANEKVTTLPDGSCTAVAKADCPPNKICRAPEKHPVTCP